MHARARISATATSSTPPTPPPLQAAALRRSEKPVLLLRGEGCCTLSLTRKPTCNTNARQQQQQQQQQFPNPPPPPTISHSHTPIPPFSRSLTSGHQEDYSLTKQQMYRKKKKPHASLSLCSEEEKAKKIQFVTPPPLPPNFLPPPSPRTLFCLRHREGERIRFAITPPPHPIPTQEEGHQVTGREGTGRVFLFV